MRLLQGVQLAMQQILAERLKSFFSLLGIIVGIMFLTVVVGIVEGTDRYVTEDVANTFFGINTITMRRAPTTDIGVDSETRRSWRRHPRLTRDDARAVREGVTIPVNVLVESRRGGMEVVGDNGRTASNVSVIGATSEVFAVRNWNVEDGRPFSPQEAERGAPVMVLGSLTADVLFEDLNPIGRFVRVRGLPYRVIGVLEEQGTLFGQSLDGLAIAPDQSPIQSLVSPRGWISQIVIQVENPDQIEAVRDEVEGLMRTRRRLRPATPNDFALETADDTLSFWDRISGVLFLALPGLVGISLVVGGIVIMNIMLVSVMERTREIGERKAIGARRRDILTQFLVESITLSTVGALVGALIGVALIGLVSGLSPLPAAVSPKWLTIAILLGVAVGTVAGVYPASRAARLHPVDALRYE